MPTADHERFLAGLPAPVLADVRALEAEAPTTASTEAPLACPSCGVTMTRVHAQGPGVEIDRCAAHGTFYDRGELVALATSLSRAGWARPGVAGAAAGVAAGVAVGAVGVAGAAALAPPPGATTTSDATQTVVDVAGGALDVVDAVDVVGGLFELVGELFS